MMKRLVARLNLQRSWATFFCRFRSTYFVPAHSQTNHKKSSSILKSNHKCIYWCGLELNDLKPQPKPSANGAMWSETQKNRHCKLSYRQWKQNVTPFWTEAWKKRYGTRRQKRHWNSSVASHQRSLFFVCGLWAVGTCALVFEILIQGWRFYEANVSWKRNSCKRQTN